MNKKDLLGETSPAIVVDTEKSAPIDTKKVLRVLNQDEREVFCCYCSSCGIASYIPQDEVNALLGEHLKFKKLERYVQAFGCPHCTGERGKNPQLCAFIKPLY